MTQNNPADAFPAQTNTGLWIWWTDDRADYYECSECGYGDEGEVKFGEETNFCPCCGAKMTVPGSVKNGRIPVRFCE